MDPLEIVQSTADAAFATDEEGRIVIWNRAAERLLGHPAARVLGRPCHQILCGVDVFGNRYCHEECNLSRMVRRGEPIRRFELDLKTSAAESVRSAIVVLCVRGPRASQFTLIHLLEPPGPGPGPVSAPSEMLDAPTGLADQSALTVREVEVLRNLAEGLNTREIADTLHISVATVRTHIQNILGKLEVHSQAQAVSLALRSRLI